MRRPLAAATLAAAALAAALVAATFASAAPRAARAETGWHVLSASGSVTVELTKPDPGQQIQQLEGKIVGKWRTTNYPTDLTVGLPLPRIRPDLPPAWSFATIDKVKIDILASVKGVSGDPTPGSSQPPKPFSCNKDYHSDPPEGFFTQNAILLTGGALSSAAMGIGDHDVGPYTAFGACKAPYSPTVESLLSAEFVDFNRAVYKRIPIAMLAHGRKGEKLTVVVGFSAPVGNPSGGPVVGTFVETTTLHLAFNFSA